MYIKQGKKIYKVNNEINKDFEIENITQALNRLEEERNNKLLEVNSFFDSRKEELENKLTQLNNL